MKGVVQMTAWGDESMHSQDLMHDREGVYYLGVCICAIEEDCVRRRLLSVIKKKVKKLHWRQMTRTEKQKSIQSIARLPLKYLIVKAAPLDGSIKPERARRKCLEMLLQVLEQDYGVTDVVLESREASQDDRDLKCIMGLRSRQMISNLRVTFAPGASDARLWIPDQILGAVGDMYMGTMHFPELTDCIDLRSIRLC